jgi:hypothetical protein
MLLLLLLLLILVLLSRSALGCRRLEAMGTKKAFTILKGERTDVLLLPLKQMIHKTMIMMSVNNIIIVVAVVIVVVVVKEEDTNWEDSNVLLLL